MKKNKNDKYTMGLDIIKGLHISQYQFYSIFTWRELVFVYDLQPLLQGRVLLSFFLKIFPLRNQELISAVLMPLLDFGDKNVLLIISNRQNLILG